ncbi:Swarming motility protein ybiA [Achromatium sp. WMS1]|nr:Swarming motility protein ybiA [Achromatium sp. WMS1]
MVIYFYTTKSMYGEFSNFAPYGIEFDGLWWPTVEHYFQAQKFIDKVYQEQIRTAAKPALAKKLGRTRQVPLRQDWEMVKDEIMLVAVRKKFAIHQKLKKLLLNTGNSLLVENAPTDYYWGCGQDGTGKNRLGITLMQVRSELSALDPLEDSLILNC